MLTLARSALAILILYLVCEALFDHGSGVAMAEESSPSTADNKPEGGKSDIASLPVDADPSRLSELPPAFASSSNETRLLARRTLSAMVVGTYPTRLENRLGDYSEEELKANSERIIRDHETLVNDWKQFSTLSADQKASRIKFLTVLLTYSKLLSEEDKSDIATQLNELQLSPRVVSYQYANALVMLGFNYQYFRGLQSSAQVLDCLKRAMNIDEKLATDAVFVETAKKALAQTDSEFCALYKKATNKDFDPTQ